MISQTIERLQPEADTAILYVHGILGTPMQFRDFFPLAERYSQCSLQLDGHGGDAGTFSKTSMKKWKAQVNAKVAQLLQTHRSLILVAHSMGTLFAISASIREPERIKGLFLVDVPLQIRLKPSLAGNCWKVFWDCVKPDDVHAVAAKQAYGIGKDYKVWRYLGWIPRYLELFREIRSVKEQVNEITVPCVVFQSAQDEMVGRDAATLLQRNPGLKVYEMPNSTHFYYAPEDRTKMLRCFTQLLVTVERDGIA